MAVPVSLSQVPNIAPYAQYVAAGGQTVYPYPFPITEDSDLIVVINGVTQTTDSTYSVSGVGNDTGGNCTLDSGSVTGDIVTLYRDIPIERISQIAQNSGFSSTVFNAEFNNFVLIAQQLQAGIAQCLQIPNTNNPGPTTVLSPAAYAGKYLSFDLSGNPQPALLTPNGTLTAAAVASLLASYTAAAITPTTQRSSAEIDLSVTPVNYAYPVDPCVDPRRYGADPTGFFDATAAVQTAINVAYAAKGTVVFANGCNYLVGALTLALTGNAANDGFAMIGMSPNGSGLIQKGTPSALITVSGPTPTGNPAGVPVLFDNFSIQLSGTATDGIVVQGESYATVRRVFFPAGGNRCIYAQSALTCVIENNYFANAQYGVYARADSTGAACNLLRIQSNVFAGNLKYAVDFDQGSELQLVGNDMELNGTTSNSSTGAIHIGGNINANVTPPFGLAKVWMQNNWLEGNKGGYSILVDAPVGGIATNISIVGGHTVGAPSGQAINVVGATRLFIQDHYSPSAGDTWNLTATYGTLINTFATVLTDTGITYPTYVNVSTATQNMMNGRLDSFVGTLTGCTTSPTATFFVHQQGDEITLSTIANLLAVSNTTACTVTGLPSKYQPNAGITFNVAVPIQDNSAYAVCPLSIVSGSGTMTLQRTFTSSGNKGLPAFTTKYRLNQ